MSYKYKGDYEKNIVFEADITSKEQVTQYLSVLYESDRAFEELIQYFQKKDEKTIILMFGEHQPVLGSAFYNYMYGHEESYEGWSEQEIRMRYQVPYIIWKNYETSSEKSALENRYPVLSSNYLSLMLLEEAGLPLNNWYEFLKEVYNEYPVVSCSGIQNKEGQWLEDEKTTIEESPELLKYNQLQYYRMFDE